MKRFFGSSLLLRCCYTQRFGSVCPAVELEMLLAWIRASSWMDGIRPPVSHKSVNARSPQLKPHRLYFLSSRSVLPSHRPAQPLPSQQSKHPPETTTNRDILCTPNFPHVLPINGTSHRYTLPTGMHACMHQSAETDNVFSQSQSKTRSLALAFLLALLCAEPLSLGQETL